MHKLLRGFMARKTKLLTEEIVEKAKAGLAELERTGYIAIKLRAVIAASKYGITQVARIFDITKATLISWIKQVKNSHIEMLGIRAGRGRKQVLSDKQKLKIGEWINKNSQITIKEVWLKIEEEFGIKICRATAHNIMKELKFSYITPRSQHFKQDHSKQEIIKKKSNKHN